MAATEQQAAKSYARLEGWIWVLIYGGLLLVVLGIVTGRESEVLGWSLAVPGVVVTAVGAVLIYVRSRLGKPKS
ncbi:MAG: hypothetical protein JSS14_13990 [Proteobacteria bacterium]|nr:hypothetical protein [Pseudomonadota bacterium]